MAQAGAGELGSFHRSLRKHAHAPERCARQDPAMDKLTSILAVIDPADETRHVVVKAMVLARHFRARLELFLCESERAYTFRHAYDRTGVAEANRFCVASGLQYLDSIRRSIADDVPITTHVATSSPLYEAIVRRVLEVRPDLVIKSAAGRHPLGRFTLDANDWQLARTCPVPLMLTRGRPWSAVGRFAAAVDVSDTNNGSLARSILQTAGFLSLGCGGQLDVLYSEADRADQEGAARRRESLDRLVREFNVGRETRHVLEGTAEETLPAFAAKCGYDVMILGALTRRRGISALVGTLTSRLVDELECDFVLVKPESFVSPVGEPIYEQSCDARHADLQK
jgi:universal stress protein E